MIYIAFGFMSNMKFAFMPSEKKIVERGYVPLFEIFSEFPQLRADLFFSGYSELTLAHDYPDVVTTVNRGLNDTRFRISTNGFEHIALPFVSHDCANKNIIKGIEADRKVWGIEQPDGCWPSDCAWDPTMGMLLNKCGISWVFNSASLLEKSCPGGLHLDFKNVNYLRPINVTCTGNVCIPMFSYDNGNYNLMYERNIEEWFINLESLQKSYRDDAIICIGLDMEVPLVLEVQGISKNGEERFRSFVSRLVEFPDIGFILMGDFLKDHPPKQEVYIRHSQWCDYGTGYWSSDGSQKLVKLCDAVEHYILECEEIINNDDSYMYLCEELERVWEYLLLAKCTDAYFTEFESGQGSHVRYPLTRVIITAFDNALNGYRLVRRLKQQLLGKSQ